MATRKPNTLSGPIAAAIIGLLATLCTTGIISTVSLYTRVAVLTDDCKRTSDTLNKHLEHAVDKTDYDREMADMRASIKGMATKDDLKELRDVLIERIDTGKKR